MRPERGLTGSREWHRCTDTSTRADQGRSKRRCCLQVCLTARPLRGHDACRAPPACMPSHPHRHAAVAAQSQQVPHAAMHEHRSFWVHLSCMMQNELDAPFSSAFRITNQQMSAEERLCSGWATLRAPNNLLGLSLRQAISTVQACVRGWGPALRRCTTRSMQRGAPGAAGARSASSQQHRFPLPLRMPWQACSIGSGLKRPTCSIDPPVARGANLG